MSEVLTQNQINELLSELLAGNAEETIVTHEKKVKNYDFKSPKKISKDQLKVLRGIYENFARSLSAYLSGILRVQCQIKVDAIEEQPYFEYNNALPDTVLMGVYDFKPLDENVLVELSNNITFAIVEMLLGGNGSGVVLEREFTEIEISLMERILKQIAICTDESWSNLIETESSLKRVETNSRLIQSISMDESVVIIIMEFVIKSIQGTINICVPIMNLEPILEKAGPSYLLRRKTDNQKENQNKETIMSHISETQIDMAAVIGNAVLTFKEILDLQVGDVIKLNQSVDSELKINVGGKTRFHGIPGIIKDRKHVKVTKAL
ncbi:MAG TPA: flagellar motor switch protein FliM [Ruminococcaceae bacterium]|jgi:flagellar motor switch protein FliM|nr:flagellar motor switch protein FliM [Oscillospiraceae bacterium]